jgi:hypothetical protein
MAKSGLPEKKVLMGIIWALLIITIGLTSGIAHYIFF